MFNYLDMLDDEIRNKILSDRSIDFQRQEIIKPEPPIRRITPEDYKKELDDSFPRLDDITKSGQWTSHSDKLFDPSELKNDNFNFDEWFDSLNDDQQMQYSQMIGEANEIIATLVWEKLRAIDKEEIFMNDYSKYEKWFDTLDPENIDSLLFKDSSKNLLIKGYVKTPLLNKEHPTNVIKSEIHVALE